MGDQVTVGWVLLDILRTIIVLLPAMTANTFAPFTGGRGTPVDFGKTRPDGRRYLGDGKTWSGFIGGSMGAAALGFLLLIIMDVSGFMPISDGLWGTFPHNVVLIIMMAVGSLVGDMIGSFLKRMLNRPRGMKTPFLDQWDYLLGSALFIIPFYPWWYDTLVSDHHWIALLIFPVIAYAAHVVANRIGFWIGVKKEPW